MEPVETCEAELRQGLRALEPHTKYAEAMAEATGGTRLRHDRTATSLAFQPRLRGAAFRAWDGSAWIDGSTSDLTSEGVRAVVDSMRARLSTPQGTASPPGAAATGRGEGATRSKRPITAWSNEDRLKLAREYFAWATGVSGIENAVVTLADVHDERLFLSTVGARRLQRIDRASVSVAPLAIEGGKVEFDYVVEGGTGGVENFEKLTQPRVVHAANEAKALLTAKAAPAGPMNVLFDPGVTGTFAHESFGHGTEADQMLRDRSYLKPLLGTTLGPECLTLVDDGALEGDWGTIFFDDEGFPAQRTVLVDRGKFVEVLHDRESAAVMGRRPTGNCRRADFLSRPFVRMTNTLVEPSDWTLEELVEEAKEGILLESWVNGIEDPLGGQMQIKVKKGHRIVHGEIAEIAPSMALSGKVLDVLSSIRGISRERRIEIQPGFCGKGHSDLLPTGTGGPYLLTKAIVGPA